MNEHSTAGRDTDTGTDTDTDMDTAAADALRIWPNLALERLGAQVVSASDDFFGAKERLIGEHVPFFLPEKFDDAGKWVDGWETRRKREAGHDDCVVHLGADALIYAVDIDTAFFTGNYPHAAALEASRDGTTWQTVIAATPLLGDSHHVLALSDAGPWRFLRLHIYPDGGVARLRVHGRFVASASAGDDAGRDAQGRIDLTGIMSGGRVVVWSDAHYGWPGKVFYPDRGATMGEGWETRRRREPGNEWLIVALGSRGRVQEIEVDTAHNKGNFPWRFSVQAADVGDLPDAALAAASIYWPDLLPAVPLGPHQIERFDRTGAEAGAAALADLGPVTHARINLIPDGGISRLRFWGTPETDVE